MKHELEKIVNASPKRLQHNIVAVRAEIKLLCDLLLSHEKDRHIALGAECVRAARSLEDLVSKQSAPEGYKVAVIGRFKAGKSFFVNELLGYKLAGEETNPETAAITTFSYGDRVEARIHFVSMQQWQELKRLNAADPKNPEAQRLAIWSSFPSRKRDNDDKEYFDEFSLQSLENTHVADNGKYVELAVSDPLDKKLLGAFRKELKQFTTATRPHHCLVERIEITAPSPLLQPGVLLIDTPGLDDSERFRVALTEDVVKNVDAVLFLTKSGASYGQTEKDFVLSLLRRGSIKQLIFVVTQVDHTYGQHIEQMNGDDEDPESIIRRIDKERQRLRDQIDATFSAVTDDGRDSPSVARYREQLGDMEIIFTSAINHRKAKEGKPVEHPLEMTDPGGMHGVESTLMEVLSTESRLAHAAKALYMGATAEIDEMLRLIDARKVAVHSVKDQEVVEHKLGQFRSRFEDAGKGFACKVEADVQLLQRRIEADEKWARERIEHIVLLADTVLMAFESEDAARHWRRRRSGRWGYMHDMQIAVANVIFPKVTALLAEQQTAFENFIRDFEVHLDSLAGESTRLRVDLEVGGEIQIDVAKRLREFLSRTLAALQGLIESEEAKINRLLETFVSEHVEEKLTEMRSVVSDCWGAGTTAAQTQKVKEFYGQVRAILRDELSKYLLERIQKHREMLFDNARELPAVALNEVVTELERVAADIKAAVEVASTAQKAAFDDTAARLTASLQKHSKSFSDGGLGSNEPPIGSTTITLNRASSGVQTSNALDPTVVAPIPPPTPLPISQDEERTEVAPIDWSAVRRNATTFLRRFDLFSGQSKWEWGRIFEERFVRDACSAILVDTYLDKAHQRRNLGEVVQWLHRSGSLKSVHVVTGTRSATEDAEGDQQLRELAVQLKDLGVELTWDRDDKEHDRYLLLSNGVRFDLGMGLDIYAMARNLSLSNPSLRKIRKSTTISVFGPRAAA